MGSNRRPASANHVPGTPIRWTDQAVEGALNILRHLRIIMIYASALRLAI